MTPAAGLAERLRAEIEAAIPDEEVLPRLLLATDEVRASKRRVPGHLGRRIDARIEQPTLCYAAPPIVEQESPGKVTAFSVVIPAHNEAAGIASTLDELLVELRKIEERRSVAWDVTVVDDGSTDSTAEVVRSYADRGVSLLQHDASRGYGAALKTGIRGSRHPWVLIIDADGTYPCEHVGEIVAAGAADTMVVGARIGAQRNVPWVRRPAKWALSQLASHLSGVRIVDLNSGLRLFPKYMVTAFARILPDGFSFTSTLTIAALSSGWTLRYLPINYRKREGRSKIRPIRDTIGFFSLILRTVVFFDPLRVFLPLALLFFLSSLAVGVGSYAFLGELMDVTTIILLVTGVQMLALGIVADLINRRLN